LLSVPEDPTRGDVPADVAPRAAIPGTVPSGTVASGTVASGSILSGSTVRRSARALLVAALVTVPTVGVLAVSGHSGGAASAVSRVAAASSAPLTDDRDDVAALRIQLAAAQHAKRADAFRASAAVEDAQRASRGEPRTALFAPEPSRWWRPTTGRLTQPFHPGHKGIDIGVPLGTPVVSAADGVVTFAGEENGYGTHVEVQHADGVITTYSHLSHVDVVVGQQVKAGQLIAHSGDTGHSTGPHLHFEVHPTPDTLTDPLAWLQARGAW
jgi:murein DD-endopeptidase MepM/ murein hydrolase activator NlpD